MTVVAYLGSGFIVLPAAHYTWKPVGAAKSAWAPHPHSPPRNRRQQQCHQRQPEACAPSHALARPRAHFVHHELFALAHFAVGFQERGNPRHAEIVERLAFGAVASFPFVQLLGLAPVAFRIGAGIGEGRLLGGREIERAQRGNGYSARSISGWSARGAAASCIAEPARTAAMFQRAVASMTRRALRRSPRRNG